MKEILTKKRAIELHYEMWRDMQRDLGDNPEWHKRESYKANWCITHGFDNVDCYCFLCEYTTQQGHWCKGTCPIDWDSLSQLDGIAKYTDCTDCYIYGDDDIHKCAPISEILALPIKDKRIKVG